MQGAQSGLLEKNATGSEVVFLRFPQLADSLKRGVRTLLNLLVQFLRIPSKYINPGSVLCAARTYRPIQSSSPIVLAFWMAAILLLTSSF